MEQFPLPSLFFFDGDGARQGLKPVRYPLSSFDQLMASTEATFRSEYEARHWGWDEAKQRLTENLEDYRRDIGLLWAMHPALWRGFINTGNASFSLSDHHYYGHRENCLGFPSLTGTSRELAVDGYRQIALIHELGHFLDAWSPEYDEHTSPSPQQSRHQHSTNNLFQTVLSLDKQLYPEGVADLIERMHKISYPDGCDWRDQELFAVAVGYYYGPEQLYSKRSPVLQAYMDMVVGLDIAILDSNLPDAQKHHLRDILFKHTDKHTEVTYESSLSSFSLPRRRRIVENTGTPPADPPLQAPEPTKQPDTAQTHTRWTRRTHPLIPTWNPTPEEARFAEARVRYDTLAEMTEPPVQQLAVARKELEELLIKRMKTAVHEAQKEMQETGLNIPAEILQHGQGRKI